MTLGAALRLEAVCSVRYPLFYYERRDMHSRSYRPVVSSQNRVLTTLHLFKQICFPLSSHFHARKFLTFAVKLLSNLATLLSYPLGGPN